MSVGDIRFRHVSFTCHSNHIWTAVGTVKIIGTIKMPSGKHLNIYDIRKYPQPAYCPTCGGLYRNGTLIEIENGVNE